MRRIFFFLAVLASAVLPLLGAPTASAQGNPNPGVALPPGHPAYPDLIARYQQWALSTPVSVNPALDATGAFAYAGQPEHGNLFFVTGLWGSGAVERHVTVPAGTRIFVPLFSAYLDHVLASYLFGAPPLPADALLANTGFVASTIYDLSLSVDGAPLTNPYAYWGQAAFGISLPSGNLWETFLGAPNVGYIDPAVASGYYVLLNPLAPGKHTIQWHFANPIFGNVQDITYHIDVAPGRS